MIIKKKCIFNWSGGKDSTLALHYALQDPEIEIKYLVTTLSEAYNRISMHGVRESLLMKQAESLGLPLYKIHLPEMPDMQTYDDLMSEHFLKFKAEGITHAIFGDIFLEDLRAYREEKLKSVGIEAIFPLWKKDTKGIISEFLQLNYKTVIVCTQKNLQSICGKVITASLIEELPSEIDSCGENGEFHSFAYEGPIFAKKIAFEIGEQVFRTYKNPAKNNDNDAENEQVEDELGFWYNDLIG